MTNSDCRSIEWESDGWAKIRITRSVLRVEHSTPSDMNYIHEIHLINEWSNSIFNIPIPLSEWKYGLQIVDEDGSILPFYSRYQINETINRLPVDVQRFVKSQLETGFLLVVRLNTRPLEPNELRILRLRYIGNSAIEGKKIRLSIFDEYKYVHSVTSSKNCDTIVIVKPPENFILKIDKENTKAGLDTQVIGIAYIKNKYNF